MGSVRPTARPRTSRKGSTGLRGYPDGAELTALAGDILTPMVTAAERAESITELVLYLAAGIGALLYAVWPWIKRRKK
jgi:hypothetical protein